MGESFIDKAKREAEHRQYEFEEFLIAGEIEHAKRLIQSAIELGKDSIWWAYSYQDYDSYIDVKTGLYSAPDDQEREKYLNSSFEKVFPNDLAQFFRLHGFVSGEHSYRAKSYEEADSEYIRRRLSTEFAKLGCRSSDIVIGLRETSEKRTFKKPGLFKTRIETEYVKRLVYKWTIRVTW